MSGDTVRAGRDRYLAENKLTTDSYTAPGFPIYVWKWAVHLPNPGLLRWHDLHHVVTGYGTGLIGEAEISAYELRGGCRSAMILMLCLGAILFGMFVSPRRMLHAWQRARGARTLYYTDLAYESLLEMKISELQGHLGLSAMALVRDPERA